MQSASTIGYLHGMPGGPGEWRLNAPAALSDGAWVPDCNPALADFDHLAGRCPEDVTLIGFSLGAFTALELAARVPGKIAALHLISPAGPLQLGAFLEQMAGGPLFRMACDRPALFRAVAGLERLVARAAPAFLFGRLMATAQGDDAALARDPQFRAGMATVLRAGLGQNSTGFVRTVEAYVGDWRPTLARVKAPVTIWQGDSDNWTPPAMARALAAALPGGAALHMIPGGSHYSTLRAALRQI